jgi:Concanavalin A-like lectin/glucanases superfamily
MNILILILGIVIILVLAWYIYNRYFSGVNTLTTGQISLNTATPIAPIDVTKLTYPNATRYAYGVWIYVNSWNTNATKVIFSRNSDMIVYLDKMTGTLNCIISPTNNNPDVITQNSSNQSAVINITNNFPLQKWVYIVINIDNTIVDVYLDGKMVKSLQIAQVAPDTISPLYIGNGYDAIITYLQRWSYALDPQTVWNSYMNGNGSSLLSSINAYHGNLQIVQNNAIQGNYWIF